MLKTIKRALLAITSIGLILLGVAFSFANKQMVTIDIFGYLQSQMPLGVSLIISFVTGVVIVATYSIGQKLYLQNKITYLSRQLEKNKE